MNKITIIFEAEGNSTCKPVNPEETRQKICDLFGTYSLEDIIANEAGNMFELQGLISFEEISLKLENLGKNHMSFKIEQDTHTVLIMGLRNPDNIEEEQTIDVTTFEVLS